MQTLHIVKIGGNVIKDRKALRRALDSLSRLTDAWLLVHGGGRHVDQWMGRLGATITMVEGRRVTDELSLQLAVMNYAGLINKGIVAELQAMGTDAIGLSGADLGSIVATKRIHPTIDYGFVGDIVSVRAEAYQALLSQGFRPVCCAITADKEGQLLNTNADTIAATIARAMSAHYRVHLWYVFEKAGVLADVADESSVISQLGELRYHELLSTGAIHSGMKPKLDNCFDALKAGVSNIYVGSPAMLNTIPQPAGTSLTL